MYVHHRSPSYLTFLIAFSGLIAIVDQSLSLFETAIIPYILVHFEISLSEFALWQGIVGILSIFVFVIGFIGDHFGRKTGMLVLILMMSVPALLIALIDTGSFSLFIVLYGIMMTMCYVNFWSVPIGEESPTEKRSTYTGLVWVLGLIPIYALFSIKISEVWGWQWTYGIMGIVGLLSIIPWFFMKETQVWTEKKNGIEFSEPSRTFIADLKELTNEDWTKIISLGLIYLCWAIAYKITSISLASYYMDTQGKTSGQWETILMIAGGSAIIASIITGFFMEIVGRVRLFVLYLGGAIAGFAGIALTSHPAFAYMIYFFMSAIVVFLVAYNVEMLATKIRAKGVAIISSLSRGGQVLGPLIVFAVLPSSARVTVSSFNTLFMINASLLLVALLIFLRVGKETKGKIIA